MYLEGTKSIWRERNNISEFPHVPSGDPYFRGSVSGSVVKVGQSLINSTLTFLCLDPSPRFRKAELNQSTHLKRETTVTVVWGTTAT